MRAIKLSDERSVKLPADVARAAGLAPGDRVYPVVEGKAVVLVAAPDFEATRGIAAAGDDWYGRYRERNVDS